jgi:plastocyanin
MRAVVVFVAALCTAGMVEPDEAGALSRRKECRQACGATIDACVAQGGKRRRCKRQTLKRCRQEGPAATCTATTTTVAGVPTTTTTGAGGSTTTSPGGSTTTVTTPGGTTTTGPASVHGCTHDGATDLTADPSPDVSFTSFSYSPKCVRIEAGQSITFGGSFSFHPLVGGEVVGGVGMPDPSSPIGTTSSGTSTNVIFPSTGTFPFYCGNHGPGFDMTGAVFVDP